MAKISIVTPARPGTRTGNLHTAQRYARFLRSAGHRVSIGLEWDGRPCDLLIALHARRSSDSVFRFKRDGKKPLIVVGTGTDLYRDLPDSKEARRSLDLADRIMVLQSEARAGFPKKWKTKTKVVYQSSNASLRQKPPRDRFRIAVVGHLRDEKDPFRAVRAMSLLQEKDVELIQVGGALDPKCKTEAARWMRRDRRYRWVGSVPHARALYWIARSHLLVVSSVMEGGANVICEAARIGTPVLGSRMSGNIGMLGRNYPGFYRLFDEKGLARLIRLSREKPFYRKLKAILKKRRHLFSPASERNGLNRVVDEALKSAA